MGGFLLRRLLSLLPTLLGITLVTFLLLEALPGRELVLAGASERGRPSARALEQVRKEYHLDEPAPRRYLAWILRVVRWDLGTSILDGRRVASIIAGAAVPTLALNLVALLLAFGISVPLGVAWARGKGSRGERAGTTLLLLLYAFPNFAAALLLQQLLAVRLGLFPLQGTGSLPSDAPAMARAGDLLLHLTLPALCLGYGSLAYLARFTRANLLEAIGREYLLAARARGIGEAVLAWKHALRNAAIPLLTLVGLLVPALLGGSVLIETIFSWPGIGRLYFYSLSNRDYPVVLGLTTFTALLTLGGSLLADIFYALADPRVGNGGGAVTSRQRLRRGLLLAAAGLAIALLAPVLASDAPLAARREGNALLSCLPEPPLARRPARLFPRCAAGLAQDPERRGGRDSPGPSRSLRPLDLRSRLPLPAPLPGHWMGTDSLGRDVAARLIHGFPLALAVGGIATLLALLLGIALGAAAGTGGKWLDLLLCRFIDLIACFPTLVLSLALVAAAPRGGVWVLILAIAATRWTGIARFFRGEVLRQRDLAYCDAARAAGAGRPYLLVRHILPNALSPILVTAAFSVSSAVLLEAGMSFLGLGVPPPSPSWGSILAEAQRQVTPAWWLVLFPSLALFATVLGCSLVAEGYRDSTDPRITRVG